MLKEMYSLIYQFYLSKLRDILPATHRKIYIYMEINQQGIDKYSQTNYFTYSKGELHHS